MAFNFNWPSFDKDFIDKAKILLSNALNKGSKPPNIVDTIYVTELDMGTKPPELEILEIGEIAETRFRGIAKLTYSGDAFVVLQTKIQVNPVLNQKAPRSISHRLRILAAHQPLVVPMKLRISHLKLNGIFTLVVDKRKGVTLSFKNDPLEKVDVSSTFDSLPSVRLFLQTSIENQLCKVFAEDLPSIIHELSLTYLQGKGLRKGASQGLKPISTMAQHGGGAGLDKKENDKGFLLQTEGQDSYIKQQQRLAVSLPDLNRYQESEGDNESDLFTGIEGRDYTSDLGEALQQNEMKWIGNESTMKLEFDSEARTKLTKSLSLLNLTRLGGLRQVVHGEPQPSPQIHYRSCPSAVSGSEGRGDVTSSISATPSSAMFPRSASIAVDRNISLLLSKQVGTPNPNFPGMNERRAVRSAERAKNSCDTGSIILEPANNAMAAHLGHLMNAHHTMSPYTRVVEHFALRSFPHTKKVSSRHRRRLGANGRLRRNVVKLSFGDDNIRSANYEPGTSSK